MRFIIESSREVLLDPLVTVFVEVNVLMARPFTRLMDAMGRLHFLPRFKSFPSLSNTALSAHVCDLQLYCDSKVMFSCAGIKSA